MARMYVDQGKRNGGVSEIKQGIRVWLCEETTRCSSEVNTS